MATRTCTSCHATHAASLEFFKPQKNCRFGLTSWCRSCLNAYSRKWKAQNAQRLSVINRQLYATRTGEKIRESARERERLYPIRANAQRLSASVRDRCKERGLTVPSYCNTQFFIEWLSKQPSCECCGVAFDIHPAPGVKRDNCASVDQFIPGKGYDRSNVSLICWRCNNIKRNYTAEDLRRVAAWIERKRIVV